MGEPHVEAAPGGPGDVRDHAVENAPALLVSVETVVEPRAQQTPALGRPEGDGSVE